MSVLHRKKRKIFFSALLFLLMFFCMTASAEAGWKKNANGTYSYYDENGKLVKKKWIDHTYYVNSKGIRQTGWLYKGKKWYYFSKSGVLLKDKWIKYKGNLYYAGPKGSLYVNGMYQVRGKYTYAFSKRGAVLQGRRVYNKKTYYFTSKNGRMATNCWIKINKQYYYFGETGAMVTSQWVGRYYVGKSGTRLKNCWKSNRYLGSDGKAYVGLHKIGSYYYYFDKTTYKKIANKTLTIKGKIYQFASNGRGKLINLNNAPIASVTVEDTYYTDPIVSDEQFLAAIIYCEAGNQDYEGKVAVGMVIMNRVYSPLFPSKLREIVYQKQQFEPARNGVLTKALETPTIVTEECTLAAKEVLAKYQSYKVGDKVYLKVEDKNICFSNYLFFMTEPAYKRLGLTASYKKIGDHVFFVLWK